MRIVAAILGIISGLAGLFWCIVDRFSRSFDIYPPPKPPITPMEARMALAAPVLALLCIAGGALSPRYPTVGGALMVACGVVGFGAGPDLPLLVTYIPTGLKGVFPSYELGGPLLVLGGILARKSGRKQRREDKS